MQEDKNKVIWELFFALMYPFIMAFSLLFFLVTRFLSLCSRLILKILE